MSRTVFTWPVRVSINVPFTKSQNFIVLSLDPVAKNLFIGSTAMHLTQPVCPEITLLSFHGACHSTFIFFRSLRLIAVSFYVSATTKLFSAVFCTFVGGADKSGSIANYTSFSFILYFYCEIPASRSTLTVWPSFTILPGTFPRFLNSFWILSYFLSKANGDSKVLGSLKNYWVFNLFCKIKCSILIGY